MPVITKFKLNTCVPYIIKYPIPAFDVRNSPDITPIKHIDIFILSVFKIVILFDGIINFVNICIFVALNVFRSFIFELSVFRKPLYIFCIDTIKDINIAIVIILLVFAPSHIIINGPNATFGNELNIVR